MKTKILFLTMTMVAAVLWGCSDKEPGQVIPKEGEPTYMSVSLVFPKGGQDTRAVNDPNATDEEVAMKSVHIFIYSEEGYFLSAHSMDISKFSPVSGSEDIYRSTEQISTTTGKKFVYAGINLPASTLTAIDHKPLSVIANEARTFTMAELTTISNGLPMFSEAVFAGNFSENPADPANHVSIKVKRLVAKITVEQSAGMTQAGVSGTLGPLEFAVNNFNKKMYLQQGDAPQSKDPNWMSADYDPADFVDTPSSGYVAVHDLKAQPSPAISDYNALYASENTSEGKTKKEITRVTVRSTFLPDEITVADASDPDGYKQEPRPAAITSPQTFYTVTPGVGEITRYFFNQTVADQFATDKGGTVVTYTDGLCYWDMFLNKKDGPNQWDVLRNDYYKCTITKIIAPGRETPDVTDPGVIPDEDTNIFVDIHILFWNPVLGDYILEP